MTCFKFDFVPLQSATLFSCLPHLNQFCYVRSTNLYKLKFKCRIYRVILCRKLQIIFQALLEDPVNNSDVSQYNAAQVPVSRIPARNFCSVCGYRACYKCIVCGTKYCCIKCGETHSETRCLKWAWSKDLRSTQSSRYRDEVWKWDINTISILFLANSVWCATVGNENILLDFGDVLEPQEWYRI